VNECKSLVAGCSTVYDVFEYAVAKFGNHRAMGRSLHSSTAELNLRTFRTHRSR